MEICDYILYVNFSELTPLDIQHSIGWMSKTIIPVMIAKITNCGGLKMQKKEFSVPDLKNRGWTDSLIKKFLGNPDKYRDNPYYKCAGKMKLYTIERVLQTEETPAFKAAFVISQKRSLKAKESAEKAIDTKIDKLCDLVLEQTGIYLPDYTPEELTLAACEHYNSLCWMPEHIYFKKIESGWVFREASPQSDKNFLNRITVNYLRHTYSDYDDSLDYIQGRVGKDVAYSQIREEVDEAIYNKYPWLLKKTEEAA